MSLQGLGQLAGPLQSTEAEGRKASWKDLAWDTGCKAGFTLPMKRLIGGQEVVNGEVVMLGIPQSLPCSAGCQGKEGLHPHQLQAKCPLRLC